MANQIIVDGMDLDSLVEAVKKIAKLGCQPSKRSLKIAINRLGRELESRGLFRYVAIVSYKSGGLSSALHRDVISPYYKLKESVEKGVINVPFTLNMQFGFFLDQYELTKKYKQVSLS